MFLIPFGLNPMGEFDWNTVFDKGGLDEALNWLLMVNIAHFKPYYFIWSQIWSFGGSDLADFEITFMDWPEMLWYVWVEFWVFPFLWVFGLIAFLLTCPLYATFFIVQYVLVGIINAV